MSTSSTVPTVKAALVSLLGDALDVPVEYSWPGPNAEDEMVFLGRHPGITPDPFSVVQPIDSEIPTIKAGRKQRQEDYRLPITIWSFRGDLSPVDASECESRAFELLAAVDSVLANDPKLGLTSIQSAILERTDWHGDGGPVPFQSGWVSILVPVVRVQARLT